MYINIFTTSYSVLELWFH